MRYIRVLLTALGTACLLTAGIMTAPHSAAVVTGHVTLYSKFYTVTTPPTWHVKQGDTLSAIAQAHYGNAAVWPGIYYRNRHIIGDDPNLIKIGIRLRLPAHPTTTPPAVVARTTYKPLAATAPATPHTSTPAAPTAAPPPAAGIYSYGALEQLWVSAGGPGWAQAAAASVAECESGGNPHAYNPSGASGLWQILGQVVSGYVFDPMVNALNAVSKFRASGDTWAQWVCQP
jgi:Transglycosylase SLT domain